MRKKPAGKKNSVKSSPSTVDGSWSVPTRDSLPSAVKRMIAYQIHREMARQGVSQAQLAESMGTSRAAINRLLDPENRSVTLHTLERTAQILGKKLQVFLKD